MKKFNILIAIACCCMLASCTDEFRQIQGEYSYKASGTAALDTATIALPNEIGALQVIDGKDGTLMLTFNTLDGEVYSTYGELKEGDLTLEPFHRTLHEVLTYDVRVTGHGVIYDKTIKFMLQYDGTGLNNADRKLKAENVLLVAKKNK